MWFILALIVGLTFAINRLIVRATFTKHTNPLRFGALHELLAGLLLLPFGLANFSLPHSLPIWMALIAGMLLIFLCDFFAFLSLRHVEVSLFQIINQSRHIVVLFAAYFFFSESITFIKVISILLIMLGITIAMIGKSKIGVNKGILYAFLSNICISFALLFIKMTSVDVSAALSGSLALIFSGICLSIYVIRRGDHLKNFIQIQHKKALISAVVIFAIFELSLFSALAIGQASRVIPVTQSAILFSLIGGYFFLHEQGQMKQKIIGSCLIAIGIGSLYFI